MITENQINKFDDVMPLSQWKAQLTGPELDFLNSAGLLKSIPVADLVGSVGLFQIDKNQTEYEVVQKANDFYLSPTDFSDELIKLEKDQQTFAKLDLNTFLLKLRDANNLTYLQESFKADHTLDYVGSRIVKGKKRIHFFAKKFITLSDLDRIGTFIGLNKKDDDFFVILTSNSDLFFSNSFNQAYKDQASFGRFTQINSQFKIDPTLIYKSEFKFSVSEVTNSCGSDVLVADKGSQHIFLNEQVILRGNTDGVKILKHLMENPNIDVSIQELVFDVLQKAKLTDASKLIRDFKNQLLNKLETTYGENSLQYTLIRHAIPKSETGRHGHIRLETDNMFVLVI